jgi:hypothetical protein
MITSAKSHIAHVWSQNISTLGTLIIVKTLKKVSIENSLCSMNWRDQKVPLLAIKFFHRKLAFQNSDIRDPIISKDPHFQIRHSRLPSVSYVFPWKWFISWQSILVSRPNPEPSFQVTFIRFYQFNGGERNKTRMFGFDGCLSFSFFLYLGDLNVCGCHSFYSLITSYSGKDSF